MIRFLKASAAFLAFALVSCGGQVSESEKEQRQDLTFDISGRYQENTGEKKAKVSIDNEYRNWDIRVGLELGRDMSKDEEKTAQLIFQRNVPRLSDDDLKALTANLNKSFQKMTLGVGKTYQARGGENVVLDTKGATSEIVVRSAETTFYTLTSSTVERFTFVAHVYMTAYKNEGRLDFLVTRDTDIDGKDCDGTKSVDIHLYHEVESAGDVKRTLLGNFKLAVGELVKES